jgi:hypothetical protein
VDPLGEVGFERVADDDTAGSGEFGGESFDVQIGIQHPAIMPPPAGPSQPVGGCRGPVI